MIAVWEWMKKYWQVLVAIAIAALGFFVGVEVKKRPIIVSGEDPERKKIEDDAAKKEQQIDLQAQKKADEAQAKGDAAVAQVVADEQGVVTAVTNDGDSLNAYIKDAGKQVRGGRNGQ